MRRPLCNGKSEAAPTIMGKTFFLCWRCTGGVFGVALYLVCNVIIPEEVKKMILVLCVPAVVDFYLNKYRKKRPSNKMRFLTGLLMGISVGCFETIIANYFI